MADLSACWMLFAVYLLPITFDCRFVARKLLIWLSFNSLQAAIPHNYTLFGFSMSYPRVCVSLAACLCSHTYPPDPPGVYAYAHRVCLSPIEY